MQRIRFNTDYILKPGSFHSYSKDGDGRFVTVPGNPNAACLTLKSIAVTDKGNSKTYNIYFNYNEKATHVWDSLRTGHPTGPSPVNFYSEKKDYWGYFSENCLNPNGLYANTTQSDYWTMNKIELPSGMAINWEYEPQRYDAANNQPVVTANSGKKKYGGGIRVKKMTIGDGTGKTFDRSYFYTDAVGDFFETDDNSSCHTTAEPFPYLEPTDLRPEPARGGYYTPAKVTYEMIQVVDNYNGNEDAVYHAPNGFTVFDNDGTELLSDSGSNPYCGFDGNNTYVLIQRAGYMSYDCWRFRTNIMIQSPKSLAKTKMVQSPAMQIYGLSSGDYQVSLSPSSGNQVQFQIFDLMGRCVFSKQLENLKSPVTFTIPESSVPNSPFVAKVKDGNETLYKKQIPVK